jgi:hypothetical protein
MTDEGLLSVLQAHGQEFLNSFSLPYPNKNKRKRVGDDYERMNHVSKVTEDESEEEWLGFSEHAFILDESNGCEKSSDGDGDEGQSPNTLYFR